MSSMPAESELQPSLDEARELAAGSNVIPVRTTFVEDVETPVSGHISRLAPGKRRTFQVVAQVSPG